jgi:hypothetical protein
MKTLALLCILAAPAHAKKPPRLGLTVAGAVITGIVYVSSLALAIRMEEPELALPVVGPLVDLRRCSQCTDGPIGQGEVAGLVLAALLQAGGVAMLAAGLTPARPGKTFTAAPGGLQVHF